MKKILVATLLVALANCAFAYRQTQTVLGFIHLDKTSVTEVRKYLDKHNCSYKEKGLIIRTNTACFNLAKVTSVAFSRYPDSEVINRVELNYDKELDGQTFEVYTWALANIFDKPDIYKNPLLGDKYSHWVRGNLYVEVIEDYFSLSGKVRYISNKYAKNIISKGEKLPTGEDFDSDSRKFSGIF